MSTARRQLAAALLDAAKALQKRLKTCPLCKTEFFANRRLDQIYCSMKCRQAKYERTPKRREAQRKRANEYYHNVVKPLHSLRKEVDSLKHEILTGQKRLPLESILDETAKAINAGLLDKDGVTVTARVSK